MIRLGVIGLSEGNGHPYSWSAICNGYDPEAMSACGFPSIPIYLAQRRWPDDQLEGVTVTQVWAQSESIARHIAKAARIRTVVKDPQQMIGQIDGLLLARDDVENHAAFALPFLEAGIPVYIDKTPALSVRDFDNLCSRQRWPGLIFTGTALAYASEFMLAPSARADIGKIRRIFAMTPKTWDRYAVHVVEPALRLLQREAPISVLHLRSDDETRELDVAVDGALLRFSALGNIATPIAIRVFGEKNWLDLIFRDSFSCFRAALNEFVNGIREGHSRCDLAFMRRVVSVVEQGRS